MNLREIIKEILDIASKIEYNTLSYGCKPLVMAGKRSNPAGSLTMIAASFQSEITNNIIPSKDKIEVALRELSGIMKSYDIEQLRKPIKELSAFLNTYDRAT